MRRMYSENQIKKIIENSTLDKINVNEINGEENPSVKPIYWHSITLKRVSGGILIFYFDFIILTQDETPFTKTSFLEWLANNPGAEIKAVQGYDSAHGSNLVSYFKLDPNYDNRINVSSITLSDGSVITEAYVVTTDDTVLTDNGVNKIN